ncbi:cytosine permease [Actinomadura craniellae]|uniref:Cytosine permease n=1 Tax=Actinomadura craniellae TaxID=2231787 RepID=A0A365HAN1_9ACTN|nr:cytosine permease [Actinomadura craniellae]RAY16155.1 cytosine permease [Actinomadura craniellae]
MDDRWAIERRSLEPVPEAERHGGPGSLFTLWFSANMTITAAVTGAAVVGMGLAPVPAIAAVLVGNLVGGVPMALHAVQGPRLGVPQMIQSRAQFGVYGAVVPLLAVLVMYVGFFATGTVLGGQALSALTPLPQNASIVVYAAVTVAFTLLGYRFIHRYGRWVSLLSVLVFAYLSVRLVGALDADVLSAPGRADLPAFLLAAAIGVSWQLSFGPLVADTSRYLPSGVSGHATFWFTYAGSVVGACWGMIFGILVHARAGAAFRGDEVDHLVGLGGAWLTVPLLVSVAAGKLVMNVLGTYGGHLSAATVFTAFSPARRDGALTRGARAGYILLIAGTGGVLALLGQGDFLRNLTVFLGLLLCLMTPWSAINLVDFYVVRGRRHDPAALYDAGGAFGRVRPAALMAYAAGIAVQIPFLNVEGIPPGLLVPALGGADIAWCVGLAVPALLYWRLAGSPARPAVSGTFGPADPAVSGGTRTGGD